MQLLPGNKLPERMADDDLTAKHLLIAVEGVEDGPRIGEKWWNPTTWSPKARDGLAFWLLGLCNNFGQAIRVLGCCNAHSSCL